MGLLCTGQIARHFGLPFRGGGGLNSSQVPDAQAAWESLMTMMPTFLSGTNFVMHSAGWLEGGRVAGYEKFIVDIEILQMMAEGASPETISTSLGMSPHTLRTHVQNILTKLRLRKRYELMRYAIQRGLDRSPD